MGAVASGASMADLWGRSHMMTSLRLAAHTPPGLSLKKSIETVSKGSCVANFGHRTAGGERDANLGMRMHACCDL